MLKREMENGKPLEGEMLYDHNKELLLLLAF